jgi:hypothetical protein
VKACGYCVGAVLALGAASSQSPWSLRSHPRGYVALHAEGRMDIDGRLTEPAWARAAWSSAFVDIEGPARPPPRWQTRVKMLWDATFFYVGAELVEPHLWATYTKHDSVIFHENDFEVFLDPEGDNREYYEFEINALGTYWDLRLPKPYRDGGKAVDDWEIPGSRSAVHLDGTINDPRDTDRSWSVELAFPWSVLKEHTGRPAPPRDGDQWRVNFSRVQWDIEPAGSGYRKLPGRPEHNWVWSPQFAIDMHRPELWGYVQFSTRTSGPASFVPDVSWPARAWLYDVYYAQRAYRERHKRYATTLTDLNLAAPSDRNLSAATLVARSATEYIASITLTPADGRRVRWSVDQESAIAAAPVVAR